MSAPGGLSRRETFERFHSDAIRTARKKLLYDNEAPAADIEADLAVLAAVGSALVLRRHLLAMGILASIALALVVAVQVHDGGALVVAAPLIVLFWIARGVTRRWPVRRIELASALLRRLAIPPNRPVQIRLDVGPTARKSTRLSASGGYWANQSRYSLEWLRLSVPLADGATVEIARTEREDFSEVRRGRSVRREWKFEFEDDVTLRLAAGGSYRDPSPAPLGPHLGDSIRLPEGLTRTRFEASGDRLSLGVRSALRWAVSEGGSVPKGNLDAVGLLIGWIGLLYGLAKLPPALRTAEPEPRRRTWVLAIGARGFGWLLLLLSAGPLVLLAVSLSDVYTRLALGDPLGSIGQAGEALAGLIGVVILLGGAILLWVLPRRLARPRPTS